MPTAPLLLLVFLEMVESGKGVSGPLCLTPELAFRFEAYFQHRPLPPRDPTSDAAGITSRLVASELRMPRTALPRHIAPSRAARRRSRLRRRLPRPCVFAAHIHQFANSRTSDPNNGIALCTNAY
jgi:hypothetical protein